MCINHWCEEECVAMRDQLIIEAGLIAERVNLARFKGEMPSSEDTVRLCEILDIIGGC